MSGKGVLVGDHYDEFVRWLHGSKLNAEAFLIPENEPEYQFAVRIMPWSNKLNPVMVLAFASTTFDAMKSAGARVQASQWEPRDYARRHPTRSRTAPGRLELPQFPF